MSYNILNKNVNFQGATQGTIEDVVDTHSDQAITGSKDFNTLTGSNAHVGNVLSVGTHANDHTVCISGDLSGSGNISGSAFYGDGSKLSGVGGTISALNNQSENRLVTIGATTTELDGEANLTFNGSILDFKNSAISGSGNISGSQFYGQWAGSNINGSQIQLASGGGLTDSTGLKLDSGVSAVGSLNSSDKILIFDADDSDAVKRTTAGGIAALAAVDSYGTQGANKVLIGAGGGSIAGAANLNFFGGNMLAVTGALSASTNLELGGTVRLDGVVAATPAVANDKIYIFDADDNLVKTSTFSNFSNAIAGDGLTNNSGVLDVGVSGAVHLTSDKVAITGSIAGIGLGFDGGAASISEIKFDPGSLPEAALTVADDYVIFLDGGSTGDPKKEKFEDIIINVAHTGLDASNGRLSVDVSDFLSNGADNRLVTAAGADSFNAEANLSFDGNTLVITGSMEMSGSGILTAGESITFGNDQMTIFSGSSAVHSFVGNDAGATIPTSRTYQRIDASGSARTGMRFASAGTRGQFLIVDNEGGESVTFDPNAGTALITTNTDNDTIMPGEIVTFISNGSAWFLIGGDLQAG